MSRQPIGWRMPQPLADEVWKKRRNQATMVEIAGDSHTMFYEEPLKNHQANRAGKRREEWKRPLRRKGPKTGTRKRGKIIRYLWRESRTGKFAKRPASGEEWKIIPVKPREKRPQA